MKINKNTLFINTMLVLVVLILCELYCFFSYSYKYQEQINDQLVLFADKEEGKKALSIRYRKPKIIGENYYFNYQRRYSGTSSKRPIVTMGCSYTEGIGVSYKNTFAAKLNKYTNRTVYNRGIGGTGLQVVYEQLSYDRMQEQIQDAEFIIYTYIPDHINRLARKTIAPYIPDIMPTYHLKKDKLVKDKSYFYPIYYLFIYKMLAEYFEKINTEKEFENGKPLFFKLLEETISVANKKYDNLKFVFLEFPHYGQSPEVALSDLEREKIRELGYIYISAEDILGEDLRTNLKYRAVDKDHPSGLVWEELVPQLVEKLNL